MSNDLRRSGENPVAAGGPDDEEGATRLVDRDAAAAALQAATAQGGTRRAEYRIGRRIGSGGFAEVYEADPQKGGERVALKRLLPSMRADPMRRRHLLREAHIAVQLHHPNIVRVREIVDLGDELAIVMELVEGISANHLLHRLAQRSRRLTLGAVNHIMQGLLAALRHLEQPPTLGQRPLVHADISLENVMVTTEGRIKLIDFGIAGLDASVPDDDEEGLTSIHQVAGKRSYAPPEGQRGAPSVASDLYAAGVCFWELIAGCRFPVLPRGIGGREMGSLIAFAAEGLPEGVWTMLALCLSLDPSARPGTAAEAGQLLQAASVAASFDEAAMAHLVREVLGRGDGPLPPALPAASEAHDVVASLVERVHSAFCASRVLAYEPVDPDEIEGMGGHEYIVRAERGAAGPPVPDYLLRDAQDKIALLEEDGTLLFRVRPPGAQPHVFVVQPGEGCVYDPLAQKILRNLLCPDAPAP